MAQPTEQESKFNILRTAAGIRDIKHLVEVQKRCRMRHQGADVDVVTTRNKPTRCQEIIDQGGSLYWIVRGKISVRQKIIGFFDDKDDEGRRFCLIFLEPKHILTEPYMRKPVQGWRYLKDQDTPPDLVRVKGKGDDLPQEILSELRQLGLL